MNSARYVKNKNYHLSNDKLIGYMVDIGSKFIDLLVNALKDKNIKQKFRISKKGRIAENLKSNPCEEILSMLNIYNAKLKKNLEQFEEKFLENKEFSKFYSCLKFNNSNNNIKYDKEKKKIFTRYFIFI